MVKRIKNEYCKNNFFFKSTKNIWCIIGINATYFYLIGLVILLYRDVWNVINLIYFIIGYGAVVFFQTILHIIELVIFSIYNNFLIKRGKYERLNDDLKKIDTFFQPEKEKFYFEKDLILKICQIQNLIFLNRIDEANIIYMLVTKNREYELKLGDKIRLSIIHIRILRNRGNLDETSYEIEKCKELIKKLNKEKARRKQYRVISYEEMKLSFLREEYAGLDKKMIEYIQEEKFLRNIVDERIFLTEIFIKQNKVEKAKEQLIWILKHAKNNRRYQEVEKYYNNLVE